MGAIAVQINDNAVMRDMVEIGYTSRDYNRRQAKTHRSSSIVSLSGEVHRFERPYMVLRRLLQLYATRYRAGRKRHTS